MYIILKVFCLIIIGTGAFFYFYDNDVFYGIIAGAFFGAIPAVIIGGIISVILFGSAPMECKYTQDLIAMKDGTSVSASFFLGCGGIDSEPYYIYMAKGEKGIKQYQIKQDVNEVYIRYTNGQPYMEYWAKANDPWRAVGKETPYYVFYLPQDSIVKTYEIDME